MTTAVEDLTKADLLEVDVAEPVPAELSVVIGADNAPGSSDADKAAVKGYVTLVKALDRGGSGAVLASDVGVSGDQKSASVVIAARDDADAVKAVSTVDDVGPADGPRQHRLRPDRAARRGRGPVRPRERRDRGLPPAARVHAVSRPRPLRVAAVAGVAAAAAYRAGALLPPAWRAPWQRTNHAGETVTLLEGPAYVLGATAGAALAGPAPALAGVAAGALGTLDDLAGDASSKGLRGHLGALAHGRLTTGSVKVAGLALTGLAAVVVVDRRAGASAAHPAPGGAHGAVATLVGGAVVAASANLVNLLDLRPGRALKATTLAALPLFARPGRPGTGAAAAALGAALALLGPDLAEEAMLGDTGANAAGALLGVALVERTRLAGRLGALAALAALTLASERVSFTQVIESTPGLRALDALGRRRR